MALPGGHGGIVVVNRSWEGVLARPAGAGDEVSTYHVNIIGRTERAARIGESA